MHHQQEAQPVAPCGDADVFVLRVEQQISRLHLVPRYVCAASVLRRRAATLPDDVAAAAGVVERPIHEAGAVQAVRLLCTGGVAALGCDLCRLASIPARMALPAACAICSNRCPALRAAAFACWSICRWAVCWVCCFARCWAAVIAVAGGFCAGWRGTVAVCCAAAVCSVDCLISRCRTCAAFVSCRCRTFWARYLCRAYFRQSCCVARKVRRAASAAPCCACSVAYSTG